MIALSATRPNTNSKLSTLSLSHIDGLERSLAWDLSSEEKH